MQLRKTQKQIADIMIFVKKQCIQHFRQLQMLKRILEEKHKTELKRNLKQSGKHG